MRVQLGHYPVNIASSATAVITQRRVDKIVGVLESIHPSTQVVILDAVDISPAIDKQFNVDGNEQVHIIAVAEGELILNKVLDLIEIPDDISNVLFILVPDAKTSFATSHFTNSNAWKNIMQRCQDRGCSVLTFNASNNVEEKEGFHVDPSSIRPKEWPGTTIQVTIPKRRTPNVIDATHVKNGSKT